MPRRIIALFLLVWLALLPAFGAGTDAVVTVPVASVFAKPSARAERVTQALLGDRVVVVATQGAWAQVVVAGQYRLAEGYPGWMLRSEISDGSSPDELLIRVARASMYDRPGGTPLLTAFMGTRLAPAGEASGGWQPVRVPGSARTAWIRESEIARGVAAPKDGMDVVRTALLLRGTRYLWGGLSAQGIDCSGLTFEAYRQFGITLPRDADQQFAVGEPVAKADLQPGDLVFFGKSASSITHVGIYMDNGRFVEAAGKTGVTISPLSARSGFQGARRVIGVDLRMPPPSP